MKKLITSYASTTKGQPLPIESIAHIQTGLTEAILSFAKRMYKGTGFQVIYGLENSGVYPNYVIAEGWVYDGTELFYVPAATFTATGANVALLSYNTAYLGIDPIAFSNLVSHNVHQIKTMVLSQGTTGSADVDYAALRFTNQFNIGALNISTQSTSSASELTVKTYTTPSDGVRGFKITFFGSITVTYAAATDGADMRIKIGGVEYARANTSINQTGSSGSYVQPFSIMAVVPTVNPNVNIEATIQRAGTNNATITYGKLVIEEI